MFTKRVHLKVGVSFDHVYHDRPPGDYVALLSLVVEVAEGADYVDTETAKYVSTKANERQMQTYGMRAPSVSALAMRRSSPSSWYMRIKIPM